MTRAQCYRQLRGKGYPKHLARAYKIVLRALDYPEIEVDQTSAYGFVNFEYGGRKCRMWPNTDCTQIVAHPIIENLHDSQTCPIWINVGPKRCTVKRMDVLGMLIQTGGQL